MKIELKFVSCIWKRKAKSRRLENVALQKRMEELVESRDGWKQKATERKEAMTIQDISMEELKKELNLLKKNSKS